MTCLETAAVATVSSEYNSRPPYLAENTYSCVRFSLFVWLSLSWVCQWCYCFRTGLPNVLAAFESPTSKGTVTWKLTHLFSITFYDNTRMTDNWIELSPSVDTLFSVRGTRCVKWVHKDIKSTSLPLCPTYFSRTFGRCNFKFVNENRDQGISLRKFYKWVERSKQGWKCFVDTAN